MNTQYIPSNISIRILDFFNSVREVNDITDTLIQDDPSDGPGNTIGPTLAGRILRTRSEQESNLFENLEQLDAIQGFGEGVWKDLVYTFGKTAAEDFRYGLYEDSIIYEANWPVWFFEYSFEDTESFQNTVDDEALYRTFISEKLAEIAENEDVIDSLAQSAFTHVKTAYIDRFEDPVLSAVYFASWFYRLDPGNWFSFDRMYAQTMGYFEYYAPQYSFQKITYNSLLEFIGFKGVPGTIMNPAGIAANDLITVVNHPEQCITIWMTTLYD